MKFYNFSISAAASFIRTKNRTDDIVIHDWPDYTYDVSLKYDDERSFRALLKGRYVWWHKPADFNVEYDSFIFDLNLIKTILRKQDRSCEIFLAGHNIFNGSRYEDAFFRNARRWFEGGLRLKF
jgi:vitamin B12 transporter